MSSTLVNITITQCLPISSCRLNKANWALADENPNNAEPINAHRFAGLREGVGGRVWICHGEYDGPSIFLLNAATEFAEAVSADRRFHLYVTKPCRRF